MIKKFPIEITLYVKDGNYYALIPGSLTKLYEMKKQHIISRTDSEEGIFQNGNMYC